MRDDRPRGSRWRVDVPTSHRERVRGLRERARLSVDDAMLFEHCRSVHTIGMRFPITVAALDREWRVLRVSMVRPRRVVLPRPQVRHVLELAAEAEVRPGDRLVFDQAGVADPRTSGPGHPWLYSVGCPRGRYPAGGAPAPPSSSGLGRRPFKAEHGFESRWGHGSGADPQVFARHRDNRNTTCARRGVRPSSPPCQGGDRGIEARRARHRRRAGPRGRRGVPSMSSSAGHMQDRVRLRIA